MTARPGKQGLWGRFVAWSKGVSGAFPKLGAAERIATIVCAAILGAVAYENYVAWTYKPDISTWSLIFEGDMAAGLLIVAIIAAAFEFWKLRRPPSDTSQEAVERDQ